MTMMKREGMKRLAVPLALAFLLTVGAGLALGREKYQEKFERTEPLAKSGKVYLSNVSGDIKVQTWDQGQVKIEALKVSEASSMDKAKENAALVPIEVSKDGDTLRIETKYPEKQGFWGGNSVHVSIDYKLWIPDRASLEVKSVSGEVTVAAIGGTARLGSVSGNIELGGAAWADVNVVSGDVTVRDILGDAYLKTVSGDVTANKVRGSVEAQSVSGDIELKDVSEAKTVTCKTVGGSITYIGTILAGGNYELTAHSGDVEIRIPATSAFDLEAGTFSGTIDSDFEIQVMGKISPKEIHGTVNGGGARIRVKTFSGNVEIKKH
jgi:DUF4097 and DUF4098 domain-containing protein YvlB